jgi:hypothetical protein
LDELFDVFLLQIDVSFSFDPPRRNPEHPRHGIDSPPLPPCDFVAAAVIVTVMGSA